MDVLSSGKALTRFFTRQIGDKLSQGFLQATDRTVRLPGSSHAESTLASWVDVRVFNNIEVVKAWISQVSSNRSTSSTDV
mmetsp:Transcript_27469/g.38817  ORF Transcript_27469/g.38817 Transcript_27469/m.38817 type:complete len:80 (+) Transcript_27469:519-758(+)